MEIVTQQGLESRDELLYFTGKLKTATDLFYRTLSIMRLALNKKYKSHFDIFSVPKIIREDTITYERVHPGKEVLVLLQSNYEIGIENFMIIHPTDPMYEFLKKKLEAITGKLLRRNCNANLVVKRDEFGDFLFKISIKIKSIGVGKKKTFIEDFYEGYIRIVEMKVN